MGVSTAIAWTDHTFNPWWGCERVSPGCQHCYAETFAKRTGNKVWGKTADRRYFGEKHWAEPRKWNTAAETAGRPALVFCASMADVFEDRDSHTPWRHRLFQLIEETPWLTWQLLTKRPENVRAMVPPSWLMGNWPSNVWIGTTVEDQGRAIERIPLLVDIPAPVRFLSCEPLLGMVEIEPRYLWCPCDSHTGLGEDLRQCDSCRAIHREVESPDGPITVYGCAEDREFRMVEVPVRRGDLIDWVICGGESGPGHRPLDLNDARALRDQCSDADVPFFFKQVGGYKPTAGGDLLDGEQIKQFPPIGAPS